MSKTNKELATKIVKLCFINQIKDSELHLKFLTNQAKFYQSDLELLEETKPFFFQKKKLEERNKKIEEQNKKFLIYIYEDRRRNELYK